MTVHDKYCMITYIGNILKNCTHIYKQRIELLPGALRWAKSENVGGYCIILHNCFCFIIVTTNSLTSHSLYFQFSLTYIFFNKLTSVKTEQSLKENKKKIDLLKNTLIYFY